LFPKLKLAVRPRMGRLLVFANTAAGSDELYEHAAHAGAEVKRGTKWVASTFWRQSAWHQPRSYPAAEGDFSVY